ncbi:unnamed protein product, partial [Darwinula stevensoni]
MPNGLLIPIQTEPHITLVELKTDLWEEASHYPLFGALQDRGAYVFQCINQSGRKQDLTDESYALSDVRPFVNLLRVVPRKETCSDKVLDAEIGLLIGRELHQFHSLKNSEVNDFRWQGKQLANELAVHRENLSWKERVLSQHPIRLLPPSFNLLRSVVQQDSFVVLVQFQGGKMAFTMSVKLGSTPTDLICLVLSKKPVANSSTHPVPLKPEDLVLKFYGLEEYLLEEVPLIHYVHIQESLLAHETPILVARHIDSINVAPPGIYCRVPDMEELPSRLSSSSSGTLRRKRPPPILSWDVSAFFTIKIHSLTKLTATSGGQSLMVGATGGVYHAGESLCEQEKALSTSSSPDEVKWEEEICFCIKVSDLPRMATLCLAVYELQKLKSRSNISDSSLYSSDSLPRTQVLPIGWVNTPIFDFRGMLKKGVASLPLWPYSLDVPRDGLLCPSGTNFLNPNVENLPVLTMSFAKYDPDRGIQYPPLDKIFMEGKQEMDSPSRTNGAPLNRDCILDVKDENDVLERVRAIIQSSPAIDGDLHTQDKDDLWISRQLLKEKLPDALPKLLRSVEWTNRWEVCEMLTLLQEWPLIPAESALELFSGYFLEPRIREYAVDCLKSLSDEELFLYLLHLICSLRQELYLHNSLADFLLDRALKNKRIGHFFFWLLRSEMGNPHLKIVFGLYLEVYCRGSADHMNDLSGLANAVTECQRVNLQFCSCKEPREKLRFLLQDILSQGSCLSRLSSFLNPLEPSARCEKLLVQKCKVMNSKNRPLWLVWSTSDMGAPPIQLIFKNGDDLRQDMLTIHALRLMDRLWKHAGLDLRLSPYSCLGMDFRLGFIEVVPQSETLANIQKEKAPVRSAFSKAALLSWLRDHNPREEDLETAIQEFTLSCAGYSVATYVLGIADRHSDNIMLRSNGQLFHIDFGHILGHFKEKFGIRRERVPFVLTKDFVYVVGRGSGRTSQEFQAFQTLCEKAYMVLRCHGNLLLSLFSLMLPLGLPELTSPKDLEYLKDTLVLHLSHQDALQHFRTKFSEALNNSWKVLVNWYTHNLAKSTT